ncbi:hypothetical protein M1P56_09745 [Streptomyces sp. HU2014]|uniref:hypothetical protein n=1 Tax=Streptomyces sp. HU2014 TaxID=2939414 RepID=UPI00200FF6B0|nr:hypothetical protein [Streptomyces sp. HU2014]UQI44608.1 hypothetical protein M1P56_09745 [Streptomyces sp. HU2014]
MKTETIEARCEAIIRDGGLTFSPVRPAPVGGYMVSVAGSERMIPLSVFGPEMLAAYVADYSDRAMGEGFFFGAWVDGGFVYLDLSVNLRDRSEAEVMGRLESQLAIYDVANGSVISL